MSLKMLFGAAILAGLSVANASADDYDDYAAAEDAIPANILIDHVRQEGLYPIIRATHIYPTLDGRKSENVIILGNPDTMEWMIATQDEITSGYYIIDGGSAYNDMTQPTHIWPVSYTHPAKEFTTACHNVPLDMNNKVALVFEGLSHSGKYMSFYSYKDAYASNLGQNPISSRRWIMTLRRPGETICDVFRGDDYQAANIGAAITYMHSWRDRQAKETRVTDLQLGSPISPK